MSSLQDLFEQLFSEARSHGGLEYVFALVRVNGISTGMRDPLLQLQDLLASRAPINEAEMRDRYCSLASVREPLELVANLVNCKEAKPYTPSPFSHLWRGRFPNAQAPRPSEVIRALSQRLQQAGLPDVRDALHQAYPDPLLDACTTNDRIPPEELHKAYQACCNLLLALMEVHRAERQRFRSEPRLYRLPRFEVLELLVDDDAGLSGLQVHFSNGTTSRFQRGPDFTECTNMMPLELPRFGGG